MAEAAELQVDLAFAAGNDYTSHRRRFMNGGFHEHCPESVMLRYKAGYKFVDGGVHAQVLDFPAVITCAADLSEARHLLAMALLDVTETRLELGQSLPTPNPLITDPDMDVEEPIYMHLSVSTDVVETPAGEVAS